MAADAIMSGKPRKVKKYMQELSTVLFLGQIMNLTHLLGVTFTVCATYVRIKSA